MEQHTGALEVLFTSFPDTNGAARVLSLIVNTASCGARETRVAYGLAVVSVKQCAAFALCVGVDQPRHNIAAVLSCDDVSVLQESLIRTCAS